MTKPWVEYKPVILSLYKEQHKTLVEVRKIMIEVYGFKASIRAYRNRFVIWGVTKYICRRRQHTASTSGASDPGYISPGVEHNSRGRKESSPRELSQRPQDAMQLASSSRERRAQQQMRMMPGTIPSDSSPPDYDDSQYSSTLGDTLGGALAHPLPGIATMEPASRNNSASTSRNSSFSQPRHIEYNVHNRDLQHQTESRHGPAYSASPTEYGSWNGAYNPQQHQQFPQHYEHSQPADRVQWQYPARATGLGAQQYRPQTTAGTSNHYHPQTRATGGSSSLAPPEYFAAPLPAQNGGSQYAWPPPQAPPYRQPGPDGYPPRE